MKVCLRFFFVRVLPTDTEPLDWLIYSTVINKKVPLGSQLCDRESLQQWNGNIIWNSNQSPSDQLLTVLYLKGIVLVQRLHNLPEMSKSGVDIQSLLICSSSSLSFCADFGSVIGKREPARCCQTRRCRVGVGVFWKNKNTFFQLFRILNEAWSQILFPSFSQLHYGPCFELVDGGEWFGERLM